MESEKLNIDEVMALAMTGMPSGKVRKTGLTEFDRLYEENYELPYFEAKANEILDKQEAMGIKSISIQDDDFPKRLLKIGDD